MPKKPQSELPLSDLSGNELVKLLRTPGNAARRAEAAQALGELGDVAAVESLVRATLEDSDENVQAVARAALTQLLGNTAEDAIASYQAGPPAADAWIEPMLAGDLLKETLDTAGREDTLGADKVKAPGGNASWSMEDVDGLLAVVRSNASEKVRLRAIEALKNIEDSRVADVLTSVVEWGEGKAVRQAAKDALEDLVGDNLPEVLPTDENDEDEDDLEDDEEDTDLEEEDDDEDDEDEDSEDEDEEELIPEYQTGSALLDSSDSPVIQEDSQSGLKFLAVLLVVVAVGLVLYLVLR